MRIDSEGPDYGRFPVGQFYVPGGVGNTKPLAQRMPLLLLLYKVESAAGKFRALLSDS